MIEEILDDDGLLLDRLLRSLHRARDGHLAAYARCHESQVEETHNVAVLYVYTLDSGAHMLHEHYIYSHKPCSYSEWHSLVVDECLSLQDAVDGFYGAYGWLTSHLSFTPLRTGDLFIRIDARGATGVRLSFDTRKSEQDAHS